MFSTQAAAAKERLCGGLGCDVCSEVGTWCHGLFGPQDQFLQFLSVLNVLNSVLVHIPSPDSIKNLDKQRVVR